MNLEYDIVRFDMFRVCNCLIFLLNQHHQININMLKINKLMNKIVCKIQTVFIKIQQLKNKQSFQILKMDSSNQFRQNQPDAAHKIDLLCLAIIYVSLFSCLIRSDYNFVIIFFVYFLWQQKYSPLAPHISLAAVAFSLIFDILFAIVEIPVWSKVDDKNDIWQTLKGMHNFGVFCYVLILLLKLGLAFYLWKVMKKSGSQ